MGPVGLIPHQGHEGGRAGAPQQLLRSVPEARHLGERQVDPAARGIGLEIAQDVRELQGDPEIDRVIPAAGVATAENRQTDQSDGGGDPPAVDAQLLEGLVTRDRQIHLDPGQEFLQRLPGDAEPPHAGLQIARHGERRPPAVAQFDLLAIQAQPRGHPPGIDRPLVRQVVDDPAERVHRLDAALLLGRQKPEGIMKGRPGGGPCPGARASRSECTTASLPTRPTAVPRTFS